MTPEVDDALGGRPAPGGVELQVQQRHLPHVAGERVGAGVLRPRPGPGAGAGRGTGPGSPRCMHAAGLADDLRVGRRAARRRRRGGRAGSAPRWGPAAAGSGRAAAARKAALCAAVRAARPGRTGAPRAGAARWRPRPPARRRSAAALAVQPLSWKRHNPRRVTLSRSQPATPHLRGPGERPGPRDERLDRLGPVLAPGTLMPEAQAAAVQLALAAGHRAVPAACSGRVARGGGAASNSSQSTPHAARARRQPRSAGDVAAVAVGQPGVRHGHAAVRRCPGRR